MTTDSHYTVRIVKDVYARTAEDAAYLFLVELFGDDPEAADRFIGKYGPVTFDVDGDVADPSIAGARRPARNHPVTVAPVPEWA